jgi:hypothetical protein
MKEVVISQEYGKMAMTGVIDCRVKMMTSLRMMKMVN